MQGKGDTFRNYGSLRVDGLVQESLNNELGLKLNRGQSCVFTIVLFDRPNKLSNDDRPAFTGMFHQNVPASALHRHQESNFRDSFPGCGPTLFKQPL